MEILQPIQGEQPSLPSEPTELEEAGITLKNLKFLDRLGLNGEMDNPEVMEKVGFLSERLDLEELNRLDLRLGYDDTPRIDKIYSYVKLLEMENKILEERDLINKQKQRYESS